MRKHTMREFWSLCILCWITQTNAYALAETTILQEIQAKVSPQQVTENALSRGISVDDIIAQLVKAGIEPTEVAKVVTRSVPQEADHIAVALVELAPGLAESIAVAVVKSLQIVHSSGKDKVTICHEGHSITISTSALKAHQAHGDVEGACAAMALEVAIIVAKVIAPKNVSKLAASISKIVPDLAVEIVRELSLIAPEFAKDIAYAVVAATGQSLDENERAEVLRAAMKASVLPTTEPITADRISVSPSQ